MFTSASSTQMFGKRRIYRARSKRGLFALYGSTGLKDSWFALDQVLGYFTPAVNAGHPVASMDMGTKWANSSFHTDMASLRTAAEADYFAPFDAHAIGVSMGGLSVCMDAINNPDKIRSLQLVIPAIDPLDVYTNDRAGFAAEVSAAHGGAPPDSANASTEENMAALAAFPIKVYYSTNDTVTPLSVTQAFIDGVTAAGGDIEGVSLGAAGHSFLADNFTGAAIAEFIAEHD